MNSDRYQVHSTTWLLPPACTGKAEELEFAKQQPQQNKSNVFLAMLVALLGPNGSFWVFQNPKIVKKKKKKHQRDKQQFCDRNPSGMERLVLTDREATVTPTVNTEHSVKNGQTV